ncbi:uncharacterized protein LOC133118016 [Conger conger]|uniref:uncharacterized protein LOC133118016 n=1 Tax=Conger conger TaxID=82655 RepID=UPI002A5AF1DB|nr:uncharacterized protein LOC133118016 [Conger conger]
MDHVLASEPDLRVSCFERLLLPHSQSSLSMRSLVCSAVSLLALAAVCHAGCYLKPMVLTDLMHPPKGCQDEEGEMHDFMALWEKNCHECVCLHHGMICCDQIHTAKYIPFGCKLLVDRNACTSKVVQNPDYVSCFCNLTITPIAMRLLCSAVAVLALATICNASCSFQQLVLTDPMHPPQGCLDEEGKLHVFGSEWVKDCQECSCSQEGLSCCSMIMIPSDEELPPDCEILVDKTKCSTKLVLKSDKTKECVPA